MNTIETDVLVIGAGPSGTVAAAIINKAGYKVNIVEKTQFPRFVIGESLLPRCLDALEDAGLLQAIKDCHFQEKTGAKFVRHGKICDFTFKEQFTQGLNHAFQVTRADFDMALANECEKQGVPVAYTNEVIAIDIADDGTSTTIVKNEKGETYQIKARFIVDGSGYGRVIPKLFGLEKTSSLPPRKALLSHLEDPKRHEVEEPNRIVIYVHNETCWIWTIPFATGITSVGFVSTPDFFEPFKGTPEEQLRAMIAEVPELKDRFKDVKFLFEPRVLQSWSSTTDTFFGKGFVLTGNVTEFLDPVFSSGVTLATVSSQVAAKLVVRQLQGEQVDWQKEYMEYLMQGVDVFRTYVNAWYDGDLFKVFFADDKNDVIKRQICSVLAGYVWDIENPFVRNHERSVKSLVDFLSNKSNAN